MFAAARDLARMDRALRTGTWKPLEGPQLLGKTLGVIGLGGIGREVARIGKGIGMNVVAYNRSKLPMPACRWSNSMRCWRNPTSCPCISSSATKRAGSSNAARIARMKKGVIFVNTARAALVDETAMMAALASGQIGHAALDVYHAEPLKPDHPLTRMENVTLSAHAAFRTPEASMTLLRRAIDIVKSLQP